MSFKHLFSRSLGADPSRLHMAAHSHHLWPDASFDGQVTCWNDAAMLADRKWDKVLGEVWPEAQGHVARELGSGMPDAVVFATNTHDFLVRLFAAAATRGDGPLRVLATDGEFHSARRQLARWEEAREVVVDRIAADPADSLTERFLEAAASGRHDLILVSQVLFGSGAIFGGVAQLASLAREAGQWVIIDGYHAFMALEEPLGAQAAARLFYLGGGYKYAMAGEGCAFLHAPPGFGERPPITGWFAEFEDLTLPPGMVGYASDATRFMGATFDPSALYRFNAVQRMLASEGLTTGAINAHVAPLLAVLVGGLDSTPLRQAELLNPLSDGPHSRFVALKSDNASEWSDALGRANCITDVRGDVLRIGLGLYHDPDDIERFLELARAL